VESKRRVKRGGSGEEDERMKRRERGEVVVE
jgi:hypothetical protein